MNFHIMTLFPEMVEAGLNTSIIGRAVQAGHISIDTVNFREYTNEKHGHVDDTPYGGGAGMIIMCQPVYDAWKDICEKIASRRGEEKPVRVLYTSPAGARFDQDMAVSLAGEEDLIILCGHYEGVDQRVLDLIGAQEVSIGDYVLTGGELAAMVMMDAISRMIPGVLTNELSGLDESFSDYLLEYPQYTRPEVWHEKAVPEILLSGHHANVDRWRRDESIKRTLERRPELLEKVQLDKKDQKVLRELLANREETC